MKQVAESGQIQSPAWWVDQAIYLTALWQGLKDKLTIAEINYLRLVEDMQLEHECSNAQAINKAKIKIREEPNEYQVFKYLEGRDKIIKEFILLAKKRAQIESYE